MTRLERAFSKKRALLSVYLTAGYPKLNDTVALCEELEGAGVDMIEIGFPFSDPVADGPVIQRCAEQAIRNGMTVEVLFEQLERLRERVTVPVFLMGYLNPAYQFGFGRLLQRAKEVGIDGLILPDLPIEEFASRYQELFDGLYFVGLISPTTPDERVRWIDSVASGFLYVVSAPGVTGEKREVNGEYLRRISSLGLKNPLIVGFGIGDRESFEKATQCTSGAIVGTAFLRALGDGVSVRSFIDSIRGDSR